ncbi:MAG: hypothetical protein U1F36_02745 [Planctomycetota bacterium]
MSSSRWFTLASGFADHADVDLHAVARGLRGLGHGARVREHGSSAFPMEYLQVASEGSDFERVVDRLRECLREEAEDEGWKRDLRGILEMLDPCVPLRSGPARSPDDLLPRLCVHWCSPKEARRLGPLLARDFNLHWPIDGGATRGCLLVRATDVDAVLDAIAALGR